MSSRFGAIAFTPAVKRLQERDGSRASYARGESEAAPADPLGAADAAFIAGRDSFYMATVSENGWPYVQHRGGPPGFLKVLGPNQLGFADFGGNRQLISTGNLAVSDRVALFLMDYPNQRRLKVLGRARVTDAAAVEQRAARLRDAGAPVGDARRLAGGVEVAAGGQVHHRVRPPLHRPHRQRAA